MNTGLDFQTIKRLVLSLLIILVAVYGFQFITNMFMSMIGGPCTSTMATRSIGCESLSWLLDNMYAVWTIHIVVFGAVIGLTRNFTSAAMLTIILGIIIIPFGLLTTEILVDVFYETETTNPYLESIPNE